jgi:hypothetical protein
MKLRTLLLRTCALSLLGLSLLVGGCTGSEETGVADEPNIGPAEPPGKPADVKASTPPAPTTKGTTPKK